MAIVFSGQLYEQTLKAGIASTMPTLERVEAKVQALKAERTVEPPDSLRRRAVHLADAIEAFSAERQASHPPYARNEPNVSPEQKLINDISNKYDDETQRLCLQKYKEEIVGIPRELRSKGLDVKYLDQFQPVRCLYPDLETELLRNLAYHLDEHGNVIHRN